MGNFESALFYFFILFIITVLTSYADSVNRYWPMFLGTLLLASVVGLRAGSVGIDTASYISVFQSKQYSWFGDAGFALFSDFFNNYANVHVYFYAIALITYFLFMRGIWYFRKTSSVGIIVFLFLLQNFFPSMNTMRQLLAVSIVFASTKYLIEKKYLKYVLGIVIASLIHASVALGIFSFGISLLLSWKYLRFSRKVFFIITAPVLLGLLILIFYLLFAETISIKIRYYFQVSNFTFGLFGLAQVAFNSILAFYFFRKQQDETSIVRLISIIYILGSVGMLIGYLYKYMDRLFLPFTIFQPVFYSFLWKNKDIQKSGYVWRISLKKFLVFAFTLYPFINSIISNSYKTIPYAMFFL